jgi:hypothetical protein
MDPQTLPIKSEKKSSAVSKRSFLASNVTRENYTSKASDFVKVAGEGFIIALREGKVQNLDYDATPKQWGAWRAYFVARKINTAFMDKQGNDGKPYTVPAEWPHLFDADATVQDDYAAGEYFISRRRPERQYNLDTTIRRAVVSTKLGYDPVRKGRNDAQYAQDEKPQGPSQEYLDALLASHDAGVAEIAARKGDRHTRTPSREGEAA